MGLLLQQLLLRSGVTRLVVVDRNPARLELASRLGAQHTATSVEELDGEQFHAAIDATGVPRAIEDAFSAIRRGGRLLIFGVAPGDATVSLSPFRIYNDEITVVGSMAVLHSYGAALDIMAAGQIDTALLLTHALALDEFPAALDMVRSGQGLKVQVLPNG